MDQIARRAAPATTRPPVYFRTAIGLLHRRLSVVILIVSALVVWTLRGAPGALGRAFWPHS